MGLMLVALASAAALGLTAAAGVSFNITTTQVSAMMYMIIMSVHFIDISIPCSWNWCGRYVCDW